MNDDSGYQALTNLYTLSVDDINVPTLTTQNLFVDNAYIVNDTVTNLIFQSATGTHLNLTNFSTVNFSSSTGYIAQIGCQGFTGGTGFFTNLQYGSSTGNTGYVNTLLFNSCSGSQGTINILNSNSIRVNRTMQNFTGPQGFYNTALVCDQRVVNNFDLCRNILRFHTPVYQSPNNGISNPQTLINTTINGIIDSDGNYSGTYYVPASDGTIPHGQPFYILKRSGFGSVLAMDRTDLNNPLILLGGYSNMLYILIYNAVLSVYEYQGAFPVTGSQIIPTPNQFNSRDNSFTLPTTRGSNNNVLTSNGVGATTWSSNLNINSISVPQGSATAPSISITNDTNTGIYQSALDNIDISTGGVSRLNVSNSGVFVQDIRVNSGVNGQLAYFQPTTKYLSSYNQLDLPVSNPTQTALNLKANIANPSFTGQLTSSGNIFLLSSGVDSEIKILTSDNRVSKLSLKEFTDSYGFELFYNGATNSLSLNRRNANNVNVFTTSVNDGYTNWNAPVQFSLGMSGSTGIFGHIATNSLTGNNGFVNSLAYQSSTGNIAFCNTLGAREMFGITGNFNIVRASINLESPVATINQLNSSTGTFSNYLVADNRVVNNYELTRSISRFYPEVYYSGVSSPTYTDPLVFPNTFQNGLIISDTSFQSLVYMPARDSNVIPNGQPVYYNMTATINSSFISNIGTNMPSNLMMPLSFNRTYIFIFNANTSLYEYQGFVPNLLSTPREFNGRANSFTLPSTRPKQFNLLSALSSGTTEWTDDISIRNCTSTGANIAFLNTTTCTGVNGHFSNLNTNDSKLHLGNLAGELTQGSLGIALGVEAGRSNQSQNCIAIGYRAGNNNQGISIGNSIAIGGESGQTSQRTNAIALGILCGRTSQRENAISIGYFAGNSNQNSNSIAIGNNAGSNTQSSSSIAIGLNAGSTSQGTGCVAIGKACGNSNQNEFSIAIGNDAGLENQSNRCVAIGYSAGFSSQRSTAIAIGDRAGSIDQRPVTIAIGSEAGYCNQSTGAIAIGFKAGIVNQHENSIIINASSTASLNSDGANRCFIKPLRGPTTIPSGFYAMYYNPTTAEVIYDAP